MKLIGTKDQIQLGSINTSRKELIDIIKAWAAISLAFAILLGGSIFSFNLIFIPRKNMWVIVDSCVWLESGVSVIASKQSHS